LLGADILLLNKEKNEMIFAQIKSNKADISAGIKEFQRYPFPDNVKRWVVLFEPRKKEPIIRVVEN